MKKLFVSLVMFSFLLIIVLSSCSKNAVVVQNQPFLLPLKAGNSWIYQDSTYDTTGAVTSFYPDTAVLTNQVATSSSYPGTTFYGFIDTIGWFGANTYLANASDVNFSYILLIDSLDPSPYIFFQSSPSDNYLLGTGQQRIDSACIGTFAQYGYASTTLINGYSCIANVGYVWDCNQYVWETVVIYVCPNVGIVRIEDYHQKNNSANPPLYLDYSQTLQKFIPH